MNLITQLIRLHTYLGCILLPYPAIWAKGIHLNRAAAFRQWQSELPTGITGTVTFYSH